PQPPPATARANLHQMPLHATQQAISPTPERRLLFPANVLGEEPRRLDTRMTSQVPQCREPPHRARAEEIAPAAVHLHAPHDQSGDHPSDEGRGRRGSPAVCTPATAPADSHIALRADSACAIDA